MNALRLAVSLPGADAGALTRAAVVAERFGVDIWVGDPRSAAPNSEDDYVMAAAAGVAAVTRDVRLGVFLDLAGTMGALRLAEDLGVVDQAARGRLEAGMVLPGDVDMSAWMETARGLLGAWWAWPAQDGRTVAATPAPAQPWLPRLVVGDHRAWPVAEELGAGVMWHEPPARAEEVRTRLFERRTVLAVAVEGSVASWLGNDPVATVAAVRHRAASIGAHEVNVSLIDPSTRELAADIQALGTVVSTGLRCSLHTLEATTLDAWTWLTELSHLHAPPD